MYTIRPFDYSQADYEAVVMIRNLARPDSPRTITEWQYEDSVRREEFPLHRDLIFTDAGQTPIAFANYGQSHTSYHPQKYYWRITVHPDHVQTTVYAQHLAHLIHVLADKDLIAITADALDNQTVLLDFLASQNFVETMRFMVSQLDTQAVDLSQWAELEQKVRSMDVHIKPLSDLISTTPDWQHKLYELDWLINRDMPNIAPPVKSSFEQFKSSNIDHPKFDPDFWFIAVHEGEFVGLSQYWSNREDTDLLKVGDSGVIRDYRRRGIVTALKVESIRFAQSLGVPLIRTTNALENPMYQINLRLGFQPLPSWVDFEKSLKEAD